MSRRVVTPAIVTLVAALGAGAVTPLPSAAGPAAAAGGDQRQSLTVDWTTARPGAPVGSRVVLRWINPDDPEAKPYGMKRLIARLPPGFAYDTGALERCAAGDMELLARGSAACSAESVVSRGTMVTDGGDTPLFPRYLTFRLTMFNTEGGFASLAELVEPSYMPSMRVVARNTIDGNVVTTEFPTFPTPSGPDGYMAFRSMEVATEPATLGPRPYTRNPATCPAEGRWTLQADFVYQDGVTQTVAVPVPCEGAAPPPPRHQIAIRGVPRRECASRPFVVRVRVASLTGRERVVLLLDRRRIRTARGARLIRWIRPAGLRRGRHRLTVQVRGGGGLRAQRSVSFRACG